MPSQSWAGSKARSSFRCLPRAMLANWFSRRLLDHTLQMVRKLQNHHACGAARLCWGMFGTDSGFIPWLQHDVDDAPRLGPSPKRLPHPSCKTLDPPTN